MQQIIQVIATYWVVSISMVYLNKLLLSDPLVSIPAPLFITWFQCIVTVIICVILGKISDKGRGHGERGLFGDHPQVKYDVKSGIQVLPLSLIFVAMITFNNLCLKYVEVSFYNVARSLSLVFNVLFTYLILGNVTSRATCATLVLICVGFYAGIDGEINFSLKGTTCGVFSSIFVSLNSIYTAKVLPKVDGDKSLLLFYNNVNGSILFLPFITLFELSLLHEHVEKFLSIYFWLAMIVSGIMGYAIGLVTVMQVKYTSPLTHNISGTAKAAVQSLLAFYIWGNEATFNGILGILFVIIGSGLYTWVQMITRSSSEKDILPFTKK